MTARRHQPILFLAIVLLLANCTPGAVVRPTATVPAGAGTAAVGPISGGTLHYGLTLAVSGIDPHIHASSELGIALSSVYDTLVAQDKAGSFHPYLARTWTISDDGRTYSFALRQDVKFHDGTPFNAAAVVRNLQRITDPKTHSQKAVFLLGPFDHAEAVDPDTVKIVLKQPYPALLDGLSQIYLGMASPAALDKWGDQYQLHQVGTGPFRFVSFKERNSLVLERNPDYNWAPEIRGHQGPAYLDRIEFAFYADAATRLPALLAGQADVMGELPPNDAAQMGQTATEAGAGTKPPAITGFKLYPVPVPGQSVQFFLNTTLAPLDDLRVRRALLYGTDRAAIVQAVFGPTSPVASGPLTVITRGADPSLKSLYPFDLNQAKALLAQAGWVAGKDGMLARNGQTLVIKGIVQTWGNLPQIGTILQAQWRSLGIDLRLEQMTYPAALEAGRGNNYHLVPFSISFTDPGQLRQFFHGGEQFNWSHIQDSQIDGWLDQAGQVNDWNKRADLYASVQQRIMDQAWVLPIRDSVNLNAAATRVQGLSYDVQGWFPVLYDVWLK
ncbi:MAG TPA: ABC transporter substrate-binding protein [Anaerolineae bacterium]